LDTYPISSNSLENFFHINGAHLGQQYKDFLSDYRTWDQKEHADKWVLFPRNIGPRLSIDETSLSNGELYTILTNKEAKGKKGTIVAMVEGTTSETIINVIAKIPLKERAKVCEITLDMAGSMNLVAKKCFPNAEQSRLLTGFMFKNWLLMPFRKFELHTVGKLSTKKPMRLKTVKLITRDMYRRSLKMGKQKNNFCLEADIYFLNRQITGL